MSSPPRINAVRNVSAIGAGMLLAATPHCGGKSVEESHGDVGGNQHGGASGSAGSYDGGYGGAYGGGGTGTFGGYGGAGTGGYGGVTGVGGSYGGAIAGAPGTSPCQITQCYTPPELQNCWPNVDGGLDSGTGEAGAAGQANEPPMDIATPPPMDAGIDSGGGAPIPEPPVYDCPTVSPFPQCVMSPNPPPPYSAISLQGWNGTACCYLFNQCA